VTVPNDEKPTSIWKKEISFRRKASEEGAADTGAASVWKKEISLRRKGDESAPEEKTAADPETTLVDDPAFSQMLEIVARDPVAAPTPVPEPAAVTPVEHDWLTKPLEEVSEPPPAPPSPISLVPPVPAAPEPTVEPFVPEPVAAVPEPEPALLPEPVLLPEPEPELDLELDLELPAAVLPALPEVPEPVAMPEPAPVAPAAVAEAAAQKTPFYKKQISLKRTPKTPKPERPKPERAAKAHKDGDTKVPFYKKQLSLKRSTQEWDAAEPVAQPKAKQPKVPRSRPVLPSLSLPSFGGGKAKSIVGLKVGGSQIAAARVNNGDEPELVQAVREPLEHGVVVGGELRDPEALAVALKEFFAKHKLPKRAVRLGIANNRIGVRTFDVTGIEDPKQLANAIRFRAQEVLPIPLEEAVLDYQVLSEGVTEDGQPLRRVLLVVAYRELVDRYVYACRKAGLQVVGIDLEAFALLRAIAAPRDQIPGSERAALVAVSVGHERSTFAVSDGRVCEFTRVLEWGGWALNVAIARALDLSPSEVEPLKRALSFSGVEQLPDGFSQDQLDTAREAARKQLQTFARELVSSLQFYQNQPGSLGIGEIAITGGTAHMPGLGAELERLLAVPVRIADPLNRLKVSKKVREREQVGSLAVAIGLGIED
jgi:type IV pilus assembly protein PilM